MALCVRLAFFWGTLTWAGNVPRRLAQPFLPSCHELSPGMPHPPRPLLARGWARFGLR